LIAKEGAARKLGVLQERDIAWLSELFNDPSKITTNVKFAGRNMSLVDAISEIEFNMLQELRTKIAPYPGVDFNWDSWGPRGRRARDRFLRKQLETGGLN
jgi:hypothetical protein